MTEAVLEQEKSPLEEALIESMVEAIRFDVDYHCFQRGTIHPANARIDYNLYQRTQLATKQGQMVYSPQLRRRVYSVLFIKGTPKNHELFDIAMSRFKHRLCLAKMKYSIKRQKALLRSLRENTIIS